MLHAGCKLGSPGSYHAAQGRTDPGWGRWTPRSCVVAWGNPCGAPQGSDGNGPILTGYRAETALHRLGKPVIPRRDGASFTKGEYHCTPNNLTKPYKDSTVRSNPRKLQQHKNMPNGAKSGKAQPLPKWLSRKQRKQVEGATGERRASLIATYSAQRKTANAQPKGSGQQQGGAHQAGGHGQPRPRPRSGASKMPLLSVMPFSGYNDGLPSHMGDHSFPATLHSITGGSMDPSVAFTMYVIPGWESNRPWARATITTAQVNDNVGQVAWATGTSFALYNGFTNNILSQPDTLKGIQQRTVSCACRVRATSSAVNTSGMVFTCSGYFDYSAAWSPAYLANYVDTLKQSNHLRPRSLVSTTSRPLVASAAPKSSVESRTYRGVIGIPTSLHRTTEGDKDEAESNVVQVERGHEDIIVIMSDASSTVTWNFEVERKVEMIGSEGILLHAKTRRPVHPPEVVAAADAVKQQHAMQSGQ